MFTFFTLRTALFSSVHLYYTCILSQHHFKHTVHEDKSNLQCIHVNWVSGSKIYKTCYSNYYDNEVGKLYMLKLFEDRILRISL